MNCLSNFAIQDPDIVYLVVGYPAIKIIGIFSTIQLAELCVANAKTIPDIINVHILQMPFWYVNNWGKMVEHILQHLTCDVCGGIAQCDCKYHGLENYIVCIKMRANKCQLIKDAV